ncbi:SCP2 sterol-binding domain-containing protein [Acidithiobacillus sp. M4-SHS-6]|uniref:SCP2 sterol-binding domain-containing protein n=1 Tax=Acidithiobacillus sp. M4-SHS-6 TaxID=3383024 RepID=UPI0039BE503A
MHPFLSLPWMEDYVAHCSKDAELVQSLKGFTALIEYGWLDAPLANVYLHMRDGLPQSITDSPAQKVNMRVHARPGTWQRIYQREISAKKALLIHELKFKGSMLMLLKYMDPLNTTFRRMGDVPATFQHE